MRPDGQLSAILFRSPSWESTVPAIVLMKAIRNSSEKSDSRKGNP